MNKNVKNNIAFPCQFCIGAKRSGEGHTLKTCPFLKENICNYCQKKGHTAKHCNKKNTPLAVSVKKPKVIVEVKKNEKQVNRFAALEEEVVSEEVPNIVPKSKSNGMNYAAALAKPPVAEEKPGYIANINTNNNANKKISWAQMNAESDDDEEDKQFIRNLQMQQLSGIKRKTINQLGCRK